MIPPSSTSLSPLPPSSATPPSLRAPTPERQPPSPMRVGGASVTVIGAITTLAQLLEHTQKIKDAIGIQIGGIAAVAIVLLAFYFKRQDEQAQADRADCDRDRAERERSRFAYQQTIERLMERHSTDVLDSHTDLKTTITMGMRDIGAKFDALAKQIEERMPTGQHRRISLGGP